MQTCPLVVKYKPSIQHFEIILNFLEEIYSVGTNDSKVLLPTLLKFVYKNKAAIHNFGKLFLEHEIFWFNFYGAKSVVDCERKCVT